MSFYKCHYEKVAEHLQSSAEIVAAIETVTGEKFQYDDNDDLIENDAVKLWENGGRESDVLAALPLTDGSKPIEEETEIYWGDEGKFAEFDGEKWILYE